MDVNQILLDYKNKGERVDEVLYRIVMDTHIALQAKLDAVELAEAKVRMANECLREALGFYADADNHESNCLGYTNDNVFVYTQSIIDEDYGEKARQALGGSQ